MVRGQNFISRVAVLVVMHGALLHSHAQQRRFVDVWLQCNAKPALHNKAGILAKATTGCIYMSFNLTNRRDGLQSVTHKRFKSLHIHLQTAAFQNG